MAAIWSPASTQLTTVNEFNNLSFGISYTDELGTPHPVTITTTQPNSTVVVSGNTITGYYSDAFNNSIEYRDNNDNLYKNVPKFSDIDTKQLSEMIEYKADTTSRIVYSYTATASTGATQTYTINLDNNWNTGRDELLRYIATAKTTSHPKVYTPPRPPDIYPTHTTYPDNTAYVAIQIDWINTTGASGIWYNGKTEQIFWTNKVIIT
jgi:hypothetical protein